MNTTYHYLKAASVTRSGRKSIPKFQKVAQKVAKEGGSPGLVAMGDGSCLRGREFKSWHRILDGHDIFHIDLLH